MGIGLQIVRVENFDGMEQAFRTARERNTEALLLLSSPIFGTKPATSAELASRLRFPAISMFPEFAKAGGLLAYGPNPLDLFRQAGTIVGKVLAGSPPGILPVERPARVQLIVNLTTARALGLTVPLSLLTRADELIE